LGNFTLRVHEKYPISKSIAKVGNNRPIYNNTKIKIHRAPAIVLIGNCDVHVNVGVYKFRLAISIAIYDPGLAHFVKIAVTRGLANSISAHLL